MNGTWFRVVGGDDTLQGAPDGRKARLFTTFVKREAGQSFEFIAEFIHQSPDARHRDAFLCIVCAADLFVGEIDPLASGANELANRGVAQAAHATNYWSCRFCVS